MRCVAAVLFPLLLGVAGCSLILVDPDLDRLQGAGDGDADGDGDGDGDGDLDAEPGPEDDVEAEPEPEPAGEGEGEGDPIDDGEEDHGGGGDDGGGDDGAGGDGDGDAEPDDPGDGGDDGCDEACGDGEVCREGRCVCAEGFTDCGWGLRRNCRDVQTDPDNCGFCGSACGTPGAICVAGDCGRHVSSCNWCGALDECCDIGDEQYCFFLGSCP